MLRLLIVSLIWALSFSLIGNYIVGKMDVYQAIFIRFIIALIAFLPFTDFKLLISKKGLGVLGIGGLQIGIMYIFYFNSFKYLSVSEVALFTIVTPLYIALIGAFFNKNFNWIHFLNILLVIVGAGIIKWGSVSDHFILGFILVQGSNVAFALGQVFYKRYIAITDDKKVFFSFYLGALIPICFLMGLNSSFTFSSISLFQWAILVWLGLVASGLGYYLWNTGAKLVSYGQLAVMNNLVIPLAILVNVVFWNEQIKWGSFLLGGGLIFLSVYIESLIKKKSFL